MELVVIGAGLSGLAAAVRAAERGVRVTVLERAARPGGNVWTERDRGFTVELGPNGVFDAKPHAVQLAKDVGLGGELLAGSEESRKNRFLFVNDRLTALPSGPGGVLRTPLLSPRGRLQLLLEPFRRRKGTTPPEESVHEFAVRRFGREAAETFVDGLVTGIYGGDPSTLSLPATFPRLANYERTAGGVVRGVVRAMKAKKAAAAARGEKPQPQRMWSFPGGLRVLVERLVEKLNGSVTLGAGVKRITRDGRRWTVTGDGRDSWTADAVLLTTPAAEQAELLADLDAELAEEIAGIRSNRIAVVALGYRKADVRGRQDGFGYIAPQRTGRDVLGVQWCSSVFADRAPPGCVLWRALVGGVRRGDLLDLNDEMLVRTVHAEVNRATPTAAGPVFTKVVRWPRAIPQYMVGHPARVARIEARAATYPGLFLGGTAYRGVALTDCAEQAERHAAAVTEYFATPARN